MAEKIFKRVIITRDSDICLIQYSKNKINSHSNLFLEDENKKNDKKFLRNQCLKMFRFCRKQYKVNQLSKPQAG